MGDTSVTLTVHACPPHQVRAVLDLIDNYRLDDADSAAKGGLPLGGAFTSYSASTGDAEDIHDQLRSAAPHAVWSVHQDPTAEFLGSVHLHVPGLGEWGAECAAEGGPVFARDEVRRAVNEGEDEIAVLLGDPWYDAIEALPGGDQVAEPRRYPVAWDRATGLIHVEGAAPNGEDLELARIPTQNRGVALAADVAAAQDVLRGSGFLVAEPWSGADRRCRIQEAEVYRVADFAPVGWRWCAKCRNVILDPENAPDDASALCVACGDLA